jgi:hypothetical protein
MNQVSGFQIIKWHFNPYQLQWLYCQLMGVSYVECRILCGLKVQRRKEIHWVSCLYKSVLCHFMLSTLNIKEVHINCHFIFCIFNNKQLCILFLLLTRQNMFSEWKAPAKQNMKYLHPRFGRPIVLYFLFALLVCTCCKSVELQRHTYKKCSLCKKEGWLQPRFYCSKECQGKLTS